MRIMILLPVCFKAAEQAFHNSAADEMPDLILRLENAENRFAAYPDDGRAS